MVIFKVVNTNSNKAYYNVVLNGYNFAAKVREILYGSNKRYSKYYPIYDDVVNGDEFKVVVCEMNTPPERINSRMVELISRDANNYNGVWVPLYSNTINKHYQKVEMWDEEQGHDLYNELGKMFGYRAVTTIIFDYIYCHVTEEWLEKIFNLSEIELSIILKGLPTYINYLDFNLVDKTLTATSIREWRGKKDGLHTYNSPRQRFRMSSNLE